jgi:hypothetical protein
MLENLVDDWLFFFRHLDSYPLGYDNGDTTTDDIVTRFLFRYLNN